MQDDSLNLSRHISIKALENTGGTDDLSKLSAAAWKLEPRLTRVERKLEVSGYDYGLAQKLVSGYARKVAMELGIHDEFDIKFDLDLGTGYKILRRVDGPALIVFGCWPHDKLFKEVMQHCIEAYKRIRGKVDLVEWSKAQQIIQDTRIPELAGTLNSWEVDITCWRVVEVKHKVSGLISIHRAKEKKGTSWSKLIHSAKCELIRVIEKVKGE